MFEKDNLLALGISFILFFYFVDFKSPSTFDFVIMAVYSICVILFIFNLFLHLKLKKQQDA
ncbi:hypothetical protein [Rummeliibacillus sp. BSL5]